MPLRLEMSTGVCTANALVLLLMSGSSSQTIPGEPGYLVLYIKYADLAQ